jgi:hypothetical protein
MEGTTCRSAQPLEAANVPGSDNVTLSASAAVGLSKICVKSKPAETTERIVFAWQTILNAPFFHSLELAVLDEDGMHALVFPCRRAVDGWKDAITGHLVDVVPTHWRHWGEEDEEA